MRVNDARMRASEKYLPVTGIFLSIDFINKFVLLTFSTRNSASRASKVLRGMFDTAYIVVAIRPSSYVHRVTSEVAVSFLPEVVAQI